MRDGGALRADALACARHVNVAPLVLLYVRENEESSSHSWMVGLLSGDHLSGQSEGGRFLESEEARGACCGVAPTQEMMDYQQR